MVNKIYVEINKDATEQFWYDNIITTEENRERKAMRVLPMNFNSEMVRAILDGRKTVTRLICKDANELTVPDMIFYDADKRTYAVHNYANKEHTDKLSIAERNCPICPGDILYVREAFCPNYFDEYIAGYRKDMRGNRNAYKADYHKEVVGDAVPEPKWHPSIHMPKEAARIFLKVKDVRVERLQDITAENAIKEGVQRYIHLDGSLDEQGTRTAFIGIWNSTIKNSDLDRYGWDANPFVWVIEFEKCDTPEKGGGVDE